MSIVNESNATAALGGSGPEITCDKPSGTVSGDVLVAIIKCHAGSITVTSSGWTVVKEETIGTLSSSMLYLVAGGSEPSNYTFTFSSSCSSRRALIFRLSGVDNSTPSDATASSDTFSSTADLTASAITTGNANAYLIEAVTNRQSRTQDASDITEIFDVGSWGFAANGEIQSAAGSSGTKDSTLSASTNFSLTILWGLKEDSGGTTYEQEAAGTLTTAGIYSLLVSLSYAGILSTVGDLVGQGQKALAGALSSAGAISAIKIYLQALASTLTSASTLLKQTALSYAGVLTPTGALISQGQKILAGVLTSTGTLVSQGQKALASSLSSAGTLAKTTILTYTGTLTSSGTISAIKTFLQALTGTLTSAGALSNLPAKQLVGSLTSAGTVTKATAVSYAGSLSSSGSLLKKTILSYAGSLTSSGILSSIKNAVVETIDLTLNSRSVSFLLNARSTAFTLVKRAIDFTVGTRE